MIGFKTTFALAQQRPEGWFYTVEEADGEREAGRRAQAMAGRTGFCVYAIPVDGPTFPTDIRCEPGGVPERASRKDAYR